MENLYSSTLTMHGKLTLRVSLPILHSNVEDSDTFSVVDVERKSEEQNRAEGSKVAEYLGHLVCSNLSTGCHFDLT